VGSAMEMGPPADWSEGSINPSSPQLNVRHYRDGAIFGVVDLLSSPGLPLTPLQLRDNTLPNRRRI
jgi:hypothetical protein